eukprot:6439713-Lingulodinium_polyedra.AAC.1
MPRKTTVGISLRSRTRCAGRCSSYACHCFQSTSTASTMASGLGRRSGLNEAITVFPPYA